MVPHQETVPPPHTHTHLVATDERPLPIPDSSWILRNFWGLSVRGPTLVLLGELMTSGGGDASGTEAPAGTSPTRLPRRVRDFPFSPFGEALPSPSFLFEAVPQSNPSTSQTTEGLRLGLSPLRSERLTANTPRGPHL